MKIGFVGRLVARYFGPRATSVSPKTRVSVNFEPLFGNGPFVLPIPFGPWVDPRQRGADPEPIGSTMVRVVEQPNAGWSKRLGIEPPGATMPWPEWRAQERELDAPAGWSACRFPSWTPNEGLVGEDTGTCAFVFGIVRGDFGIWRSPFPVCITDDDGMLTNQREDVLAAVTHLPSGLGMGLFVDREAAIASCNAADGLGIDWRKLNPNDRGSWAHNFSRLRQAREFAGITVCRLRHAHMGSADGPPLPIWEQRVEAALDGRPEKLS